MFPLNLTLKNYRCFKASNPAVIQVRPGFTAFVGPNNSGKSTLLRFFYEMRNAFGLLSSPGEIQQLMYGNLRGISFLGTEDPTEVYFGREEDSQELIISLDFSSAGDDEISRVQLTFQRASPAEMRASFYLGHHHAQVTGVHDSRENELVVLTGEHRHDLDVQPFNETMRSLNASVYVAAFRNAIHEGAAPLYDLPIGTSFINQWDQWKAGTTKGTKLRIQEITDELASIFGFNHLDINASQDGRTLEVVADKNPHRLRELGAGFSQFVIVLALLATRTPPFLLIDEPELNLHPALQVRFLTTLAKYTKYGVMFATHSIGLARTASEYIYTVYRAGPTAMVRPYEATQGFAEFLGQMSFSTYKDVGYDTALGVEGPTEITTVEEFLRKLVKDQRIVLFPLGGGSMICGGRQLELSELRRLAGGNKIAVLIDSERGQANGPLPTGRQEFIDDCKTLDFNTYATERRAIENYFPGRAIQTILGPKYRALQPYEPLDRAQLGWSKAEHNWRIAKEMTKAELLATDLGQFLNAL